MSPLFHLLLALSFANVFPLGVSFVISSVLVDADALVELLLLKRVSIKHRTLFHSLTGAVAYSFILFLAGAALIPTIAGAALHIFADLFCVAGVPLSYPFSKKISSISKISPVVPFPKSIYSDGDWRITAVAVAAFAISWICF